jgi:geranylgeranyl reductase family protein
MSSRADVEVAVVGAGPAGSTCAILLLERGHEVTIIDQSTFPRDKPCGDGLTRSSVAMLERLGLGSVIRDHQPIFGGRVVPRQGREISKRYVAIAGRAAVGVCVPRSVLDEALLMEALNRGAHLIQARVEAPIVSDGVVLGVRYKSGSELRELRARHVVAADGATSRLRRTLFGESVAVRSRAYAARAYFRVERELDPVFDMYVPLELDDRMLPGYAWVFPLSEHQANIGVGFFSSVRPDERPSVRRLFEAAIAYFRTEQRARFGDIEQESSLFGSPVAVRFSSERCRREGLTFVGDAANTVDPLSGEGIAYAMHGAEVVADAVHAQLSRGHSTAQIGTWLARRFPRLGQEPWRVFNVAMKMERGGGLAGALDEPFLSTVVRVAAKAETDPSIRHTPIWKVAEQHDDIYAEALRQLDEALLESTETSTPLIGEIVHREIRTHGGPVSAATALFTVIGLGGRLSREAVDFASAVALSKVLSSFVSQMSDRGREAETATANDRLVTMAADFAHSRAAVRAAASGPQLLEMFARTTATACEGQMLQREDRGRLDPRHSERIAATTGGLFALASGGGAVLARQDAQTRSRLDAFGLEFGCAKQIADELAALVAGDHPTGREPGLAARRGFYCLTVLDAARRAGPQRTVDELVEASSVDERALDCAVRAAERHGAQAKRILSEVDFVDPVPLEAMIDSTLAEMRYLVTAAANRSPEAVVRVSDQLSVDGR